MNNWGYVTESFLQMVQLLTNAVLHNCLFLVPAFMLAGLCVAMVRAVFTGGEMVMDTGFLLRGVIVWFILFNYLELLDIITGAVEGFAGLIPEPTGIMESLNEFAQSTITPGQPTPDPNASPTDKILNYVQGAMGFQTGIIYWLMDAVERGFTMGMRLVYEKLRAMLLAFLTVAGPLSLTLSVFPGMEKVAGHWFRGWFMIHMWSVTLRLLDAIIHNYNAAVFDTVGGNPLSLMDALVINVVCMLMYFMVPSLTSYFVGYAATNGFFGKLAGIVSTGLLAAGKLSMGKAGTSTASATPAAGNSAYAGLSGGGGNGGGGGGSLPPGPPPPLAIGSGGNHLLGGGSPIGMPPGGGPLPPRSGNSAASIPVRQLPVSPQPRTVPVEAPGFDEYQIV